MYIIKTMDGAKFKISSETFKKLSGKQGLVYVPEIDTTINLNSVSCIYPEKEKDKVETKNQIEGFLYDGTRVIKKFGEWVLAGEEEAVKINKEYYPEVAADCVATAQEYEEVKEGKNYYQVVGYNQRKNKELNKGNFKHILDNK